MAQRPSAPKSVENHRGQLARLAREHRLRHTATGMRFALADRIELLDAARWDAIAAGTSVFLGRKYLRALESALPDNLAPRYALIESDGGPVAAVAAQIVHVHGERIADAVRTPREADTTCKPSRKVAEVVRAARARLQAAAVRRIEARVLVCGNLLAWGQHGVAFADGVDPATAWPAVAEALYRMRRAERLAGNTDIVLVKDLDAAESAAASALAPLSFRELETEPDMVLELDPRWRTFDDYLAGLSTKYRKAVRHTIKQIEAAGCSVERASDLHAEAQHLHRLYASVQQRAAVRPVSITPEYVPALGRALGGDFRCTTIRRGETRLGFVTTLKDRSTAVGYFMGFDREANATLPLYFRLLQCVVADALELGCSRISFGRTALEPKARLGAKPVPLHLWIRHRVPVANLLLQRLLGGLGHDIAPERNPFKDEGAPRDAAGRDAHRPDERRG
ncbi:MAG: GNAT family N-acetyltransferase [Planctomycetes bacterium]|nr:GNAT family N-acetyltransferase [Planctomycetota bacterium]